MFSFVGSAAIVFQLRSDWVSPFFIHLFPQLGQTPLQARLIAPPFDSVC
jgi:hypothetical protein